MLMEPSRLTPAKNLVLHVMDSNHLAPCKRCGDFRKRAQHGIISVLEECVGPGTEGTVFPLENCF